MFWGFLYFTILGGICISKCIPIVFLSGLLIRVCGTSEVQYFSALILFLPVSALFSLCSIVLPESKKEIFPHSLYQAIASSMIMDNGISETTTSFSISKQGRPDHRPKLILVPGFWEGLSALEPLADFLTSHGYSCTFAPLASTAHPVSATSPSMATDAAAIRRVVERWLSKTAVERRC